MDVTLSLLPFWLKGFDQLVRSQAVERPDEIKSLTFGRHPRPVESLINQDFMGNLLSAAHVCGAYVALAPRREWQVQTLCISWHRQRGMRSNCSLNRFVATRRLQSSPLSHSHESRECGA